ncbi:MAG: hypothetical protein PVJ30_07980, partial [Thiohalocapsa sp.]
CAQPATPSGGVQSAEPCIVRQIDRALLPPTVGGGCAFYDGFARGILSKDGAWHVSPLPRKSSTNWWHSQPASAAVPTSRGR